MRYYDPRYDTTFKKVFGDPVMLKSFLNAMLPLADDEQVEDIEYLTPEMLPKTLDGKFSIVDVRCRDSKGRQFIVEMQMVWSEEFKTRVLFNASKAYVNQLGRGEEYRLLHPVYSLNLVNGVFEPDLPQDEFYHFYQLVHERHTDKVIKGLHIVFIELPKFQPRNWNEKKMQVLWLRFLTEINSGTEEAPAELLEDPIIGKAVAMMEESAMTKEERYRYEKNLDTIMVEKSVVGEAWEKGLAEGKAVGLAEGEAKKQVEIARKMKELGSSIDFIMQATGLSVEEIGKL